MLKKRDYLRLLAKYGYGAIAPDQVPDIDRVLIPATKLQQRVQELGEQISKDYAGKEPVLVGVLRGVLCFIADLMRQISVPTSVDLMAISSYDGNGAAAVRILKDLDLNIKGRDVILVEDIVDTGMTLNTLIDYLQTKQPASLKVCSAAGQAGAAAGERAGGLRRLRDTGRVRRWLRPRLQPALPEPAVHRAR